MTRPGIRRLAAAVAATALVGLVAPGAAAAPVPPGPVATQTPATVGIQGLEQTPWVTKEGTCSLRLALTGAPAGATVTSDIHTRVADRAEYERSILGVLDSEVLETLPDVDVDADTEERPDGSRSVSLAVSLRQPAPATTRPGWQFLSSGLRVGVYPVEVRVLDAEGEVLNRVVVHITRVPSDDEEGADDPPILVAPLITLGTGPTIDAQGDPVPEPDIARQVEEMTGGLAMGGGLPLTLIPRPESIEALARDEDAADSLAALQGVVRTRQVVDGPYVEVPLGAWVDRGLTDELSRQRDRGNVVLTEHLGRADSSTWDARAGLTPSAAAALWPVGVRTAILAPGAVGTTGRSTAPVTIAAGQERSIEAVVPDAILSGALVRRDDPVLAAADVAAELALLAATTEGQPGVVLDPPQEWLDEPANIALLDRVLLHEDAPVQAVTVAELLDTVTSAGMAELVPSLPPDLGDYPVRLNLARARLSSYASLVGSGTPKVGALDQRLLLSGSTALDADEQSAYVESVLADTEDDFEAIKAPDQQTVTLTSSDGEIPLTLLNELDRPATVTVDVSSSGRVEVRDFPPTQTLRPGRTQLQIPVHARAPGDASIDITIRTTDGELVLDEVDYTVRSTAVPGIGIVLSAGAVAFLLVWWARHWLRDRRTRGGGGGGGDDPDGPEPDPDDAPGTTVPAAPELVST